VEFLLFAGFVGLENRYTLTGIVGSNPTLSATYHQILTPIKHIQNQSLFQKINTPFLLLINSKFAVWDGDI